MNANVLKLLTLASVFTCACCSPFAARAQEATEVYVPIGKSPGVSGKTSVIGKIETVDAQTHTLKVSAGAENHVAKLTGDTKIWLDKSKTKKPNTSGSIRNCQSGLRCEVKFKYQGNRRLEEAEWIKVEVAGP